MKKDVWGEKFEKESQNQIFKFTSVCGWMPFSKHGFNVVTKWITKEDLKILEAGCGSGRKCIGLAEKFPDSKIIGIDLSTKTLKIAKKGAKIRKLTNVTFKKSDIFNLPFKKNYFDVVFNTGVIEHFEDYREIICEMKRVAKKEGKIIIAVPNKLNLFHLVYNYFDQKLLKTRRYGLELLFTPWELKSVSCALGLKNIEHDGYNPFYRLSKFIYSNNPFLRMLQRLFRVFAVMAHYVVTIPLDFILRQRFSRYFGWEIVVKGEK